MKMKCDTDDIKITAVCSLLSQQYAQDTSSRILTWKRNAINPNVCWQLEKSFYLQIFKLFFFSPNIFFPLTNFGNRSLLPVFQTSTHEKNAVQHSDTNGNVRAVEEGGATKVT